MRWVVGIKPTLDAIPSDAYAGPHGLQARVALTHHGVHGEVRSVALWPVVAQEAVEELGRVAADVYRIACEDASAYDGPQRYAVSLFVGDDPSPTVRRAFRVNGQAQLEGLTASEPASALGLAAMSMRHSEASHRQSAVMLGAATDSMVRMSHEMTELLRHERLRKADDDVRRGQEIGRLVEQVDRWMERTFTSAEARETALSQQAERDLARAQWEVEQRLAGEAQSEELRRSAAVEMRKFQGIDLAMKVGVPLVLARFSGNEEKVKEMAGRLLQSYGGPGGVLAEGAQPGAAGAVESARAPASESSPDESASESSPDEMVFSVPEDPATRMQVKQILQMLGEDKMLVAIDELVDAIPGQWVEFLTMRAIQRAEKHGFFDNGDSPKQPTESETSHDESEESEPCSPSTPGPVG